MPFKHLLSGSLAALAVVAVPASAQDALEWARVEAPSTILSAETPCTESEIALLANAPDRLGIPVSLPAENRVLCKSGDLIFVAGVIEEAAFAGMDKSLFDFLREQALSSQTNQGTPREISIDGRRVLANLEVREDSIAEVGFVEIDQTRIVFYTAGSPQNYDETASAAINRFVQSIRVNAE